MRVFRVVRTAVSGSKGFGDGALSEDALCGGTGPPPPNIWPFFPPLSLSNSVQSEVSSKSECSNFPAALLAGAAACQCLVGDFCLDLHG